MSSSTIGSKARISRRAVVQQAHVRPPIPRPGDRRGRHQPLLAVLPGVDAQDAPRGVSLRRKAGPVLLDRLLHRGRRRLLVDRVSHQVAGGPGPVGPRRQGGDVLGVFATDRIERRGRRLAGLGAASGHAAGDRIWLARTVPHLLCFHPGTFRAADGERHRGAELPDLDGPRARAKADRPLARPKLTGIRQSCCWPA